MTVPASLRASLIAGSILLVISAASTLPAGAAPGGISGQVQDTIGNVLEGVEVLVAAPARATHPVAVVRSDAEGRFAVPDLLPGVYRIAALKEGYLVFVGQINTRVERWVDLVLRPTPRPGEPGAATLPRDGAWALRLPRRSIFRETEPAAPRASAQEAPAEVSALEDVLRLQVEHLFAIDAPLPYARHDASAQGTETRLRVASPLGERGNLRFTGARESLGTELSSASSEAGSFTVDVSYDTGPDDRLQVAGYYRHRDLNWDALSESPGPAHQARQAWGYQSEWSRQFNAVSRVALSFDYQDASLELTGDKHGPALPGVSSNELAISNRGLSAGGSFESLAAAGHQLEVGFRAQLLETPVRPASSDSPFSGITGIQGWSMRMNAQDSWAITGPLTLVYGLGYKHAITPRDSALIVPRMGGSWNVDDLMLRFMVAYHMVAEWENPDAAIAAPLQFRPNRNLGYEAEIELPLLEKLSLRGSTSYTPIQFDSIGYTFTESVERPIYHTDGNSAARRTELALVQDAGETTRAYLELARGQAEGMLTVTLPFDAPLQLLSQRELKYDSGRLGLRIIPSGTDLQLEYRKVMELAPSDKHRVLDSTQESLELRLMQDLLRFQTLGNWRLLMAVRLADVEAKREEEFREQVALLDGFNHGVSAGLSVTF